MAVPVTWQHPHPALPFKMGRGTGRGLDTQAEVGGLHSRQLHTSLSIRSFFCCSRVITSTSARARGSKQMSSAGTWECHRTAVCEEPQGGDTTKEWKPRRATFSTAHLLQQGLHLPFLPLLPAPVWVILQPIEVGLRSAWEGGGTRS